MTRSTPLVSANAAAGPADFPFYRGWPVAIPAWGWGLVLLAVATGFVALVRTQPLFHSGLSGFLPPLLFVSLPLGALALVAGWQGVAALFRRLRARDLLLILALFLLNAILTVALGYLLRALFETSANPAAAAIAEASLADRALFFG